MRIGGYKKALIYMIGFFLVGCEYHFTPLEENDRYNFSLYGSLDIYADTQWVRVTPILESLLPATNSVTDVNVELTRQSVGETIAMTDSIFRFGGDVYVRNYWVSENIYPNEIYTIAAERQGERSISTIVTPSELLAPDLDYSVDIEGGSVSGISEDLIVVIETRYLIQIRCQPEIEVKISHKDKLNGNYYGNYQFEFNNRIPLSNALGLPYSSVRINSRQFVVISASEDWPDLADLDEREIYLPDAVSNVEQGTGFIAGIATRVVQITPRIEPCEETVFGM